MRQFTLIAIGLVLAGLLSAGGSIPPRSHGTTQRQLQQLPSGFTTGLLYATRGLRSPPNATRIKGTVRHGHKLLQA
ncbi:hypothetical protein OEZ86_013859 [Tetradesmus obliquus]|nr:hypothetical protein OEZ86_013859 [Tetradesmus obliquus]